MSPSTITNIGEVHDIFIRSAKPTSAPTSVPSTIWQNEKLSSSSNFGPLAVSQFLWMIGLIISVFTLLPWFIFVYRRRGKRKQAELSTKLSVARLEANKKKLSENELRTRDEVRIAFREKYGRDVNVYLDCVADTPRLPLTSAKRSHLKSPPSLVSSLGMTTLKRNQKEKETVSTPEIPIRIHPSVVRNYGQRLPRPRSNFKQPRKFFHQEQIRQLGTHVKQEDNEDNKKVSTTDDVATAFARDHVALSINESAEEYAIL